MIYQHPLAYLPGLEGTALLRAFGGGYDRDFTQARLSEIPCPAIDPAATPPAAPPAHPSDIWSLWPWCPAAVNAVYRDSPILIVWHFQLRG